MYVSRVCTCVFAVHRLLHSMYVERFFFNCFALELSLFKTKQLRNVLGRVLGPDFNIHFSPIPKLVCKHISSLYTN